MTESKTILMVAAENDALPNAKVGGIGDVVRDLPQALAQEGCTIHVITPSYGVLHQLPGTSQVTRFPVEFAGSVKNVGLYQVPLEATRLRLTAADDTRIYQWVLDHPSFYPCGPGHVYCNDGSDRPFATDANKYAMFCAAVGQAILNQCFGRLDVIHLHDWHAAILTVLREYDPHYVRLKSIATVYSIHNLSLQGIRPLKADPSSLQAWFPALVYDQTTVCDPRVTHCFNPVRAAIQLADKVHAVSPTYADEIQRPSHPENFVYGGEGLEADLVSAQRQQRLIGILNGCDYPPKSTNAKLSKARVVPIIRDALVSWVSRSQVVDSAHWIAKERLDAWQQKKERGFLVTSVGRLTDQKVRLLRFEVEFLGKTQSVLEHLLDRLSDYGTLILLGSGDREYERFLLQVSGRNEHFIFMRGYSDTVSQALYSSGDLFLMPSSFEPCGISQMLAMRAGQPCLVHGVGGLNDTVIDGVSGFTFGGGSGSAQALDLIERFDDVLALAKDQPDKFASIGKAAGKARFTWTSVAREYLQSLYI